jgi:Ca-activated chloride channel homolog
LEAEAQAHGRPELQYNLGNSLIKQNKYDAALKSLRQAVGKGEKDLQESSWYNTGNALFHMDNFKDSVQAYIQALRINPADRDAKNNLEIALQKLKQQEQKGTSGSQQQNEQNDKNAGMKPPPAPNKTQRKPDAPNPEGSPAQQEREKSASPQATQAEQRDGTFTKERALQILDALQNQELAEQRKLLEQRAQRKGNGKDW